MANSPRVRNRTNLPPGGAWVYYDPDLDQMFEHYGMLDDFPSVVNRARKTNGLDELKNMAELIELYICENSPSGTCGGFKPNAPNRILTISSVANFTRTMVQLLRTKLAGEDIYNPDPSAAAQVCVNCPLNKRHMCSSCTGLESLARRLLRARQTTPFDRSLGACEACGCMLRVKVHFSPEVLRRAISSSDEALYPKDTCWIWKTQAN
jgi:hypothetical protein